VRTVDHGPLVIGQQFIKSSCQVLYIYPWNNCLIILVVLIVKMNCWVWRFHSVGRS